jgi:hypothetical protein
MPPVADLPPAKKVPCGQAMHSDKPRAAGANLPAAHWTQLPFDFLKLSPQIGALQASLPVLPFEE